MNGSLDEMHHQETARDGWYQTRSEALLLAVELAVAALSVAGFAVSMLGLACRRGDRGVGYSGDDL